MNGDFVVRTHDLKVDPVFFDPLRSGEKNFEVRRDDRGFQRGDVLRLREWKSAIGVYTGGEVRCRVSWILTGGQYGVEPGYVVMGLERIDD